MSFPHSFDLQVFPYRKVDTSRLVSEIREILPEFPLECVNEEPGHCVVVTTREIVSQEMSDLETLLSHHTGAPLPTEPEVVKVQTELNKDPLGNPRMSKYFPALGMIPCWRGYQFEAELGKTTFYDVEVWDFIRISSGVAWISRITPGDWDDYIEFSVIDKNDVLGLFSTYGLVVGRDVLECKKFVKHVFVRKSDESNSHVVDLTLSDVLADPVYPGLFFRVAYVCDGDDHEGNMDAPPPHVVVQLHFYE